MSETNNIDTVFIDNCMKDEQFLRREELLERFSNYDQKVLSGVLHSISDGKHIQMINGKITTSWNVSRVQEELDKLTFNIPQNKPTNNQQNTKKKKHTTNNNRTPKKEYKTVYRTKEAQETALNIEHLKGVIWSIARNDKIKQQFKTIFDIYNILKNNHLLLEREQQGLDKVCMLVQKIQNDISILNNDNTINFFKDLQYQFYLRERQITQEEGAKQKDNI